MEDLIAGPQLLDAWSTKWWKEIWRQTWRIPTSGEDGTSPNMWIDTVDIAIDNGLKLGLTVCRHTKFTGPCRVCDRFISESNL